MADHCRLFDLSDPKEPTFQVQWNHECKDSCDRCDQVVSTLSKIDAALIAQKGNLLPGVYEEVSFSIRQAKTNMLAWKVHILHSINQDASRIDILEFLDESSVLVVQDWAMKYLPRNTAKVKLIGSINVEFLGISV